jgi:hypothetical protein
MAERFARFPLKLCLPDPRLSVDFSAFLTEQGALAPREIIFNHEATGHDRPLPLIRNGARSQAVRAQMKPSDPLEHSAATNTSPVQASFDKQLDDGRLLGGATRRPTIHRTRPSSDASARSTTTDCSYMLSPSTNIPPTSTAHLSPVSPAPASRAKHARSLSNLSQPILKLIMTEVLNLPRTVLLEPQQLHAPNNDQKQQRSEDSVAHLQSVLMHPVFLVSRQLRQVALDTFHEKSYFILDLNAAKNTKRHEKEQSERQHKFWTTNTPFTVKYALSRVSNLQIRLPVPSTDTSAPTTSKPTSDKSTVTQRPRTAHEQEHRPFKLHETLRAITSMVTSPPTLEPAPPPPPKPLSRAVSVRRKLSFRTIKPRKDSLDFTCCGDVQAHSRRPLQNLQMILVKRSATATILPDTLDLLAVWTDIPVHGTLEYYFELDARRRLWAARSKGTWLGKEPDGKQLLQDLQALRVTVLPVARLGGRKMRLETAQVSRVRQQSSSREREREKAMRKYDFSFVAEKKARRRVEDEDEPPSVEEIQQLAEMARRGLY